MTNGLQVFKEKIIAIIRGLELDDTLRAVEALRAGGIRLVEVPFDQMRDPKDTAVKVEEIRRNFGGGDLICGSGTVLTAEQVRITYEAGGSLIVTPTAGKEVIEEAKRLGMFVMAGAMSPTETADVYGQGADVVKVFPAGVLGTGYIKALRGPFPYIPLAAVGGINLDNIQDFQDAGVSMFGIGESLVNRELIRQNRYDMLTKLARAYVEKVNDCQECAE